MHAMEYVCYLATASVSKHDYSYNKVTKLWPVKNVKLVPRYSISEQQSGTASNSTDLYYLFELGRSLTLQTPITKVPSAHFLIQ